MDLAIYREFAAPKPHFSKFFNVFNDSATSAAIGVRA